MNRKTALLLAAAAVTLASCASISSTPAPVPGGIQRTILQRTDLDGGREAVLGLAVIAPGVAAGKHTHPGVETGYVIEGAASLEIEGQEPRIVRAGDSYLIPAGKVHDAKTVGSSPVKVLATYIVEKGKPIATPVK